MVLWIRSILAVVAGLVSAFVVVAAVESIGHAVIPAPEGVDLTDHEAIRGAMTQGAIPIGALVFVVAAWTIAALAGGWVAARTARTRRNFLTHWSSAPFLTATIAMLLHLPHPLWMWVVAMIEVLPLAYLGGWLGLPRGTRKDLPAADKLTGNGNS